MGAQSCESAGTFDLGKILRMPLRVTVHQSAIPGCSWGSHQHSSHNKQTNSRAALRPFLFRVITKHCLLKDPQSRSAPNMPRRFERGQGCQWQTEASFQSSPTSKISTPQLLVGPDASNVAKGVTSRPKKVCIHNGSAPRHLREMHLQTKEHASRRQSAATSAFAKAYLGVTIYCALCKAALVQTASVETHMNNTLK